MKKTLIATCAMLILAACSPATDTDFDVEDQTMVSSGWASTQEQAAKAANDAAMQACKVHRDRNLLLTNEGRVEAMSGPFGVDDVVAAIETLDDRWVRRHKATVVGDCSRFLVQKPVDQAVFQPDSEG